MGRQTDLGHEPVYTANQIAEALSLSPETVRRWIRTGVLRAFKVGRGHRVRKSALDAFLSDSQDTATEAAPA